MILFVDSSRPSPDSSVRAAFVSVAAVLVVKQQVARCLRKVRPAAISKEIFRGGGWKVYACQVIDDEQWNIREEFHQLLACAISSVASAMSLSSVSVYSQSTPQFISGNIGTITIVEFQTGMSLLAGFFGLCGAH